MLFRVKNLNWRITSRLPPFMIASPTHYDSISNTGKLGIIRFSPTMGGLIYEETSRVTPSLSKKQ